MKDTSGRSSLLQAGGVVSNTMKSDIWRVRVLDASCHLLVGLQHWTVTSTFLLPLFEFFPLEHRTCASVVPWLFAMATQSRLFVDSFPLFEWCWHGRGGGVGVPGSSNAYAFAIFVSAKMLLCVGSDSLLFRLTFILTSGIHRN